MSKYLTSLILIINYCFVSSKFVKLMKRSRQSGVRIWSHILIIYAMERSSIDIAAPLAYHDKRVGTSLG
jgi:hypothetical protein